jgi:hypothetical protein
MAEIYDYPTVEMTVKMFEGRKIFSLYELRFSALPARLIMWPYQFIGHVMLERADGSSQRGFLKSRDETESGYVLRPACFDIPNVDRAAEVLRPEKFENGDVLRFEQPHFFFARLLDALTLRFESCLEFSREYADANQVFKYGLKDPETGKRADDEKASEVTQTYLARMEELFKRLHAQPGFSSVLDLEEALVEVQCRLKIHF